MKIKIKKAVSNCFITFGISAVIFLLFNYISPQLTIKYLWFTMSIGLVLSLCGSFVFITGITPKSLWIRRSIMMGISCLTTVLSAYLFNLKSVLSYLLYGGRIFIFTIILSVAAYLIADRIEKHNLKKINDKLKQINDKENA